MPLVARLIGVGPLSPDSPAPRPTWVVTLDEFMGRFWGYYDELLAYRGHPTLGGRQRLSVKFDELFSTKTGYFALDDRISKANRMPGLDTVIAARARELNLGASWAGP